MIFFFIKTSFKTDSVIKIFLNIYVDSVSHMQTEDWIPDVLLKINFRAECKKVSSYKNGKNKIGKRHIKKKIFK